MSLLMLAFFVEGLIMMVLKVGFDEILSCPAALLN
jgi:hypothetical protein